jgi:hypothetical protein
LDQGILLFLKNLPGDLVRFEHFEFGSFTRS